MANGKSIIKFGAEKALIQTEQAGYSSSSPSSAFVGQSRAFTGVFELSNPFGTFWDNYTQVGALALSVGGYAVIGGCDRVKITSDGNAITVPSNWVNIGTDSITTTVGTVNIIYAVQAADGQVDYAVKVIAP